MYERGKFEVNDFLSVYPWHVVYAYVSVNSYI